jgi:hypothetical protein
LPGSGNVSPRTALLKKGKIVAGLARSRRELRLSSS